MLAAGPTDLFLRAVVANIGWIDDAPVDGRLFHCVECLRWDDVPPADANRGKPASPDLAIERWGRNREKLRGLGHGVEALRSGLLSNRGCRVYRPARARHVSMVHIETHQVPSVGSHDGRRLLTWEEGMGQEWTLWLRVRLTVEVNSVR